MKINTKNIGNLGENKAAKFLENLGFCILERNFYSKYGEIDIIAKDEKYLVFVEVKFRNKNFAISPEENIGISKQKKIIKTAYEFLQKNDYNLQPRFDVIIINNENIKYIKNAFEVNNYDEIF